MFPIIDCGDIVGYVSRHIWDKDDIDEYNRKAEHNGKYRIMRYRNSTENDFVKLLYNYDAIVEDVTDTVVIVEGVFDVIALTRKLHLYDNKKIAVVATFGKKISDAQIYKIQSKGVETIVVGYDGDASEAIKKTAGKLNEYFDVYVADIEDPEQDFDSMDFWQVYDTFAFNLKSVVEYKLNKIQL
jgi:DNA primase